MDRWFDQLLEEMQRRQMERDRAREGRSPPHEPIGPPEEQIPDDEDGGGQPPPPFGRLRRRRRGRQPPASWLRPVVLVIALFVAIQVLASLVAFLTDLAWFDARGRARSLGRIAVAQTLHPVLL